MASLVYIAASTEFPSINQRGFVEIDGTMANAMMNPLSALLFNMVVDEALCLLDSLGRGGSLDNEGLVKCPAVAFAGDLVIFEDQDKYIPLDLAMMDGFFGRRGMQLHVGKCSLLSVALGAPNQECHKSQGRFLKFGNMYLV